ncbi:MAG TPA: PIN domain-containing protein [Candidatus Nanopelagicales bacterium]|nr:PIN domain-containing protein [Candidatus Nanopelagicales bacterium]
MTEFVDTSAFFALLDADDAHRGRARTHLQDAQAAGVDLLTHEYVVVETTALVQRRLGLEALRRFVDDLLPLVEVAWVDEALHGEAREALLAAGRRNVSLVDWTSFLVMRRHGVRRAFTFDPGFRAEGFEVVPAA